MTPGCRWPGRNRDGASLSRNVAVTGGSFELRVELDLGPRFIRAGKDKGPMRSREGSQRSERVGPRSFFAACLLRFVLWFLGRFAPKGASRNVTRLASAGACSQGPAHPPSCRPGAPSHIRDG